MADDITDQRITGYLPIKPDNRTPKEKRKDREKVKAARQNLPLEIKPDNRTPEEKRKDREKVKAMRYRKNGGAVMKARGGTFKGTF